MTSSNRTQHEPALTALELLDIADAIDLCENRFGPLMSQRGAQKIRAILFAAIETPTIKSWTRARFVRISNGVTNATLVGALHRHTDFDQATAPYPSRAQMLGAIKAATAAS